MARAAYAEHNGRWLLEWYAARSRHKYSEHSLGFKQPSALLSNEHSVAVWELTEIKWNG
jgi:hypothetical protein